MAQLFVHLVKREKALKAVMELDPRGGLISQVDLATAILRIALQADNIDKFMARCAIKLLSSVQEGVAHVAYSYRVMLAHSRMNQEWYSDA